MLRIFKKALRLRDKHGFMWQPQGMLNVFKMLTLKKRFLKSYNFFQKPGGLFLVQTTMNQKRMLRQIEWGVQNRPITKNGRLPPTTSFF